MYEKSSRKKGDELEKYVLSDFKELFNARQTSNSGAVFNDGDIIDPYHYIDCKNTDGKGFSIPHAEWGKAKRQARENSKEPVLIRSNRDEDIVVAIDYNYFIELLHMAYNGRTKNTDPSNQYPLGDD